MSVAREAVTFIKKNGRVIPIHAPGGGGTREAAKPSGLKKMPHLGQAAASTAIAVGEGALSGFSLRFGLKKAALVHAAGIPAEVASTTLAAHAAKAGGGTRQQKIQNFAKLETVNQVAGWAAYGAAALSHKATRDAAVHALRHSAIVRFARKAIVGV